MSAEVLRKAASLMRERAEAAMASLSDNVPEWHSASALMGDGKTQGDAEHIASWHPAAALAVADWLEACGTAPGWEYDDLSWIFDDALAVATAYLGSDA